MRVKLGRKRREIRTVWWEKNALKMIDQRELPFKLKIFSSRNYKETAFAIREMVVRGAPAIGVAAAYGVAQGASALQMKNAVRLLKEARPTAVDLSNAVERVVGEVGKGRSAGERGRIALASAGRIADENLEACRKIGEIGAKLIKNGAKILTHCNAGALACVDYGTALAPIRFAHRSGKKIFVFVDETRPRMQGSLTAWELLSEGIPHAVIADNARGYFMQRGEVDLVVVGADRIAINGDFANKIGTYEIAVLAKENNIPFYVAAPRSTFDKKCKSGNEIKIEERGENEVLFIRGKRVYAKGSRARNPAFDVTPAKHVSAFITERGVLKPKDIKVF